VEILQMGDLRQAYLMLADGNSQGRVVATGSFGQNKYAIIELGDRTYHTEIWDDRSAVKVSTAVNTGDRCMLKIITQATAGWFPFYSNDEEYQEKQERRDTQHNQPQPRRKDHRRQDQQASISRQAPPVLKVSPPPQGVVRRVNSTTPPPTSAEGQFPTTQIAKDTTVCQ